MNVDFNSQEEEDVSKVLDNSNKNYRKINRERMTHKHSAEPPHDRICSFLLSTISLKLSTKLSAKLLCRTS